MYCCSTTVERNFTHFNILCNKNSNCGIYACRDAPGKFLTPVEQLLRLDEAGIQYTTQYILGMAGRGKGRDSTRATADFFNQAHPRRLTTTGLTVFPGTPLSEMVRSGMFTEATDKEKVEELLLFFEQLPTDTFFDSVHYLNPLNYRFFTLREKDAVMDDIRDLLATHSEEEIKQMVGRHLMRSL